MKIDVCLSPVLYPAYYKPEQTVIVTDIFRASTSIVTAIANGAQSIIPVETVEEAQQYKSQGLLVGAERNTKRCDFADFGNSPFDYAPEAVNGQTIVFTTTNGTKAINIARNAYRVIIGAFINLEAVISYCLRHQKDILVMASAWEDKVNIEDSIFGGALADELIRRHSCQPASDAARITLDMWNTHKADLVGFIKTTDHYARLQANNLEDSVPYCLNMNIVDAVPQLIIRNGDVLHLENASVTENAWIA
jgi:2-phosphosulfolactate phosphatase